MRIVYWPALPNAVEMTAAKLREVPGVEVVMATSLEDCFAKMKGAVGLVTNDMNADPAVPKAMHAALGASDNTIKWFHYTSAGREGYSSLGPFPNNIMVTGVGDALASVVAEQAMALFLSLTRRLRESSEIMNTRKWDRSTTERMETLEGRRLLIIGLGNIGHAIAERALGFGMTVAAVNRTAKKDTLVSEVYPLSALDQEIPKAEAICIAIGLSPQTKHLFGAKQFALCRPRTLLVNIARGGIIERLSLLDALNTGKIAGAGLDVTDPEPLPPGDPLWQAKNVFIACHIGGAGSALTGQKLAGSARRGLEAFLAGKLKPGDNY